MPISIAIIIILGSIFIYALVKTITVAVFIVRQMRGADRLRKKAGFTDDELDTIRTTEIKLGVRKLSKGFVKYWKNDNPEQSCKLFIRQALKLYPEHVAAKIESFDATLNEKIQMLIY